MDLARQVFDAGVVGAGGAGFPTYQKLVGGANLLVVNGAECEPLLASDRYLMRHRADDVVAGARAVARACGIDRVVVGTKTHYEREIAALRAAIGTGSSGTGSTSAASTSAASIDTASLNTPPVEIHGVDSFYPAGDEQVLVYEITGQTVPPGGIPLDIGVIVINVTTAANVAAAVRGEPVTRRLVTVTGEVARPTIVDAPVGATAADLIAAAGGAIVDPYVIVRGGPIMGKHVPMADAATLGYGKADGGLIVLPAHHPLVRFMAKPVERLLAETKSMCIQCQMCTNLCPRYLIGHRMRPHRVMRSLQTGVDPDALTDALLCCECGVCELYSCPMGLSPRRVNMHVKQLLRAQGVTVADKAVHPEQASDRALRQVGQERFIDRLQLSAYPRQLDDCVRLDPAQVRVPTRHGVGRPARPCVRAGETVDVGQPVALVEFGAVGAPVHASIAGRVADVDDDQITIVSEGGRP